MSAEDVWKFLSSNTQDFIEVSTSADGSFAGARFLSSNTQDFIEVLPNTGLTSAHSRNS